MIGKIIGFIIILFLIIVFNVNDFIDIYNFGHTKTNTPGLLITLILLVIYYCVILDTTRIEPLIIICVIYIIIYTLIYFKIKK